jgi:hypothetical protein
MVFECPICEHELDDKYKFENHLIIKHTTNDLIYCIFNLMEQVENWQLLSAEASEYDCP